MTGTVQRLANVLRLSRGEVGAEAVGGGRGTGEGMVAVAVAVAVEVEVEVEVEVGIDRANLPRFRRP